MSVVGHDHVQLAAPAGCEPEARRFFGDLDALAHRLAQAGAPVHWDDTIAGRRRSYTADPWGNRIELISPAAPQR